jgi:hypothetical protein
MDVHGALPSEAPDERWRRRPLLFAPLIPAVFGVLAAVIPEWSAAWAVVNAALLVAAVAFMVVIVFRGGYRTPRLRVAIFGTLLATALLAHRYRRAILQELSEPRSRFGLFHAGLGALGGAGAALLGYTAAKGLPGGALAVVVFVVALYVVIAVHTLWVGAEDPDWRPVRRARRRA